MHLKEIGEIMIEITNEQLIEEARKARLNAYAPYSNFKVGAALLTEDGEIFYGCNVENAAYSLVNCAERTAIFSAIAAGKTKFAKLAIVCDTERPGSPCGACRQVINEFCAKDMPIIMGNLGDEIEVSNIETLLPGAFGPEDLK